MEEMLKQLVEMAQNIKNKMVTREDMKTELKKSQEELKTELKKCHEDMKKFLQDIRNELNNTEETIENSQEIKKTELKSEVEKKVRVIEEVTTSIEETATSPKSEIKVGVHRIESEDENNREQLKMENEGADSAKPNGTTDSNDDATTNNVEQKPESNDNAKEGESSGSVAAESSDGVPEGEKEQTTNLQVVWEDLQLAKRIYQKRGEEDKKGFAGAIVNSGEVPLGSKNFESAISDIKEGLRKQNDIAASTVQEQRKKLRRSQEGLHATVTELNDSVWRIPQRPRVKMRFVCLKLFEGSTDGVT